MVKYIMAVTSKMRVILPQIVLKDQRSSVQYMMVKWNFPKLLLEVRQQV